MSYEFDKEQIKQEFREFLKESNEKLPEDILPKFLEKYETNGIDKIIMEIWNKMSESKQKLVINIPGIKGSVNAKISKKYGFEAKIKTADKKYIGLVYNFEYRGLGLHTSNLSQTEIGISTNVDETALIMFVGSSVRYARVNVKLPKSLYKDLIK